jgi:anti-anti-sigma regulatory factor
MAPQRLGAPGLKFEFEEKGNETILRCTGKITAENSEAFQKEIRDLIPESRRQVGVVVTTGSCLI